MRNFNRLAPYSSVLALSIGITACGGSTEKPAKKPETIRVNPASKAKDDADLKSSGQTVTARYYRDGTRKLTYSKDSSSLYQTIFEFCDGPDLVDQNGQDGSYSGHDLTRSVDYPGCVDDGRLTPSDFALNRTTALSQKIIKK